MKAAVHQPMYLPYPGFFHKLSLADVFVIMDDVQYDKRFTNRNRILVPQGPLWVSVPINKDDKFHENRFIRINNDVDWRTDHLKKLHNSYANAPFFHLYEEGLKEILTKDWELLFDLDYALIKAVADWLGLNVKMVRESELNVTSKSTERLIDACKAAGADTYISGVGGKNYMDESLFAKTGVKLVYQNYHAMPYKQRFTDTFVPDLSIIDMLANVGPESAKLISSADLRVETTPLTA